MRKKIAVLFLLFVLVFPQAVLADAYYLAVPTYYAMWAKMLFGIEVDDNIKTTRKDGQTVTSMDKIATYTNRQTLEVEKISFSFYDRNVFYDDKMEDERIGKLLSFLCAIEGGNFLSIENDEAKAATEKAVEIITAMDNISDDDYKRIWNKEMVPFYTSEKGTYYEHVEFHSRYYVDFIPGETASAKSDTRSSVSSILEKQDEWTSKFKSVVKSRMKEYYDTTLDDFKLTYSAEEDAVQIMNVYFTWSAKNGVDMTKKMLEMFSEDLSATLHNKYPNLPIKSLVVFWKVPYHDENGYVAKYYYHSKGDKMYFDKKLGTLYGKN